MYDSFFYIIDEAIAIAKKIIDFLYAFFAEKTVFAAALTGGILVLAAAVIYLVIRLRKNKTNTPAVSETPPPKKQFGEKKQVSILSVRFCFFNNDDENSSPAEILSLLDEYLAIVYQAVTQIGGTIETDSSGNITAYWGDKTSTGSSAHDALNAVRAALLIRVRVFDLNKKAADSGKKLMPLVCGISSGRIDAGFLGPVKAKRRYLFGETGVLALKSRELAEKNKTDILITAKTWRLVKEYIIAEEVESLDYGDIPVRLFAVINLRAASGTPQPAPVTLSELRSLLQ